MNIGQMRTNIRIRCGNPNSQAPSDRTLLLLLSTEVQNFLTEANMSGRPWAVDELDLVVSPNQEDYILPIEGFGKPLQVRTVYAADQTHIERNIDFFDIGDLNFDWNHPKGFGLAGFDTTPNTMSRIAFFRKNGNLYARVIPIPQNQPPIRFFIR